jgi:hypothetical protein
MNGPEGPAPAPIRSAIFALASRYRGGVIGDRAVREEGGSYHGFPYTERHLQCLWFDPRLRPPQLQTSDGEEVEVEDPGVWNLEAGPDFLGAVLRVGPERRRLAGDVEVHIHPRDWVSHGHARDLRYARVRLHVTYFPGALPGDELPGGTLQVALRDTVARLPAFSFEAIEVAAYPFAIRAAQPPCQLLLKTWDASEKHTVLDAAGQERLRRKTERLSLRWNEVGAEQALFEDLMAGLGYQHNKAPFRRLAEIVGVESLRAHAGKPLDALGLLLGVAGLLPETMAPRWDAATRTYVRALWDAWWKQRERWSRRLMTRDVWRLQGRPANHPVRRLAAAAALFTGDQSPAAQWSGWAEKRTVLERIEKALTLVDEPYWSRRVSWGGARMARPLALVGADRAQALVVNVAVPFLAACGKTEALPPEVLAALPRETSNSLVRQTAQNLFGAHHPGSLYRTGLRRQGLLQIFHDYCLNDRSRCASCTFPALLAAWKKT